MWCAKVSTTDCVVLSCLVSQNKAQFDENCLPQNANLCPLVFARMTRPKALGAPRRVVLRYGGQLATIRDMLWDMLG